MNSKRSKPGPKPALERNLLAWEHEWYCIFHGLVRGILQQTIHNHLISVVCANLNFDGVRIKFRSETLGIWLDIDNFFNSGGNYMTCAQMARKGGRI